MTEIKYIKSYDKEVEDEIKRKLGYNHKTGIITWEIVEPVYKSDSRYNKVVAGRIAGSIKRTKRKNGYIEIHLKGVMLRAHRVAWYLHYGVWPKGEIDHINNDRSDNRISNLRVVNRSTQNKNTSRRNDNKSGITGVHYSKTLNKWIALLNFNKKRYSLGYHDTLFEAACARKSAENKFDFSENHGRNLSKYSMQGVTDA